MHQVMFEGGLYQKSLSHLQQFEDQICDKLSLMEARGNSLVQKKQQRKIILMFEYVLQRNSTSSSIA